MFSVPEPALHYIWKAFAVFALEIAKAGDSRTPDVSRSCLYLKSPKTPIVGGLEILFRVSAR